MRALLTVLVVAAAGLLGYFGRGAYGSTDTRLEFPDRGVSSSALELGCTVMTEGSAFENRLDGPSANAHAGAGTEKLALTLSRDGRTLSVLYGYDVGNGVTDPIPLAVHSRSASYIVAAGQQTLGETAVILDVKTQKAAVSFTGQGMLGIKGSSYLVQCH